MSHRGAGWYASQQNANQSRRRTTKAEDKAFVQAIKIFLIVFCGGILVLFAIGSFLSGK